MKKLPVVLGALGGALAGYLFNNTRLRTELSKAKTPEEAAKILGKHMSADGKKIGKEVQTFIQSEDVQANMRKAKGLVEQQAKKWGAELQKSAAQQGKKLQKKAVQQGKKLKKKAAKTVAKAKKNMKA